MGNEIVGVGNILIKPTPNLLRLQQKLADAVKREGSNEGAP
jgi:hypothetical protein